MTVFDRQFFDQVIDRRSSGSTKWRKFGQGVLPMWVADMDFPAPEFVLDALKERLDHPILGYTDRPPSLVDAFCGWIKYHYDWEIDPEWLCWLPGVVPGLNLCARALAGDEGLLIPTPVYHPFLYLGKNAQRPEVRVPLVREGKEWRMDFDALSAALTPQTRMLLICNPQNPTGRCYRQDELRALADFVERHNLLLVSDEIHCNIVLDPNARHMPIAQAFPEIAERTISLYAATKVYNIPGVGCAAAVIPDPTLRRRFMRARAGLVPGVGPLGFVASEAAFNDRGPYIPALVEYLRDNLALLTATIGERTAMLQGTYLAWIDVSDLDLDDTEAHFKTHGLGISPGAQFGAPDHIRLNFGCPRSTLREGLSRLLAGVQAAQSA